MYKNTINICGVSKRTGLAERFGKILSCIPGPDCLRLPPRMEMPVGRQLAACQHESTGTTGTTVAVFPVHQPEAEEENNRAFITAPTVSASFSPNKLPPPFITARSWPARH